MFEYNTTLSFIFPSDYRVVPISMRLIPKFMGNPSIHVVVAYPLGTFEWGVVPQIGQKNLEESVLRMLLTL